jgi:hypothetical protein
MWLHEPYLERNEFGVWLEWGDERTFVPWSSVVRIDVAPCLCSRCVGTFAA